MCAHVHARVCVFGAHSQISIFFRCVLQDGETEKEISVKIIDDDEPEEDEMFIVKVRGGYQMHSPSVQCQFWGHTYFILSPLRKEPRSPQNPSFFLRAI